MLRGRRRGRRDRPVEPGARLGEQLCRRELRTEVDSGRAHGLAKQDEAEARVRRRLRDEPAAVRDLRVGPPFQVRERGITRSAGDQ